MSRKISDMRVESELGKFLDKNLYSWICGTYGCYIQRICDKELQFKGVDIIISMKNYKNTFFVDEKAQLYYINKGLPTFAFEVNFLNKIGEVSEGWLFNNNLLTNYYLLIWPYANCTILNKIREEDFTKVECIMIQKNKIIEYLNGKGLNKGTVYQYAEQIRSKNWNGKIVIQNENECYFYYSNSEKYCEKPINIVIRKEILETIADQVYIVTKNKVSTLKK